MQSVLYLNDIVRDVVVPYHAGDLQYVGDNSMIAQRLNQTN